MKKNKGFTLIEVIISITIFASIIILVINGFLLENKKLQKSKINNLYYQYYKVILNLEKNNTDIKFNFTKKIEINNHLIYYYFTYDKIDKKIFCNYRIDSYDKKKITFKYEF